MYTGHAVSVVRTLLNPPKRSKRLPAKVDNAFDYGLGYTLYLARQKAQSHPEDLVRIRVVQQIEKLCEFCAKVGLDLQHIHQN